jgi:hypothetical protein
MAFIASPRLDDHRHTGTAITVHWWITTAKAVPHVASAAHQLPPVLQAH